MGEKLIENKIAKELKVSRTPVRDAFKQLVKERLIEYVPNKGCFAKGFSQKMLAFHILFNAGNINNLFLFF